MYIKRKDKKIAKFDDAPGRCLLLLKYHKEACSIWKGLYCSTIYLIPLWNPPCRDLDWLFRGYDLILIIVAILMGACALNYRVTYLSFTHPPPPYMIHPHKRAKLGDFRARGLGRTVKNFYICIQFFKEVFVSPFCPKYCQPFS
jgi:hypothetical protein